MKSALFVPCEERKLNKVEEANADMTIFDLEDSIKESDKENALKRLIKKLEKFQYKNNFVVRVNGKDAYKEMDALYECGIRCFMIPKAENVEDIEKISLRYEGIKIFLLIETPMGILNIRQLCQCSNVEYIAFGAEDFCAQVGFINREDILLPIKEAVVINAKAYSKKAFDTITLEICDKNIIKDSIKASKELGFDGKLFIHPMQVDILCEMNCVEDYQEWHEIIELFDNSPEGVLVYKNKVYEKPHIEFMRRSLYEAENN